MVKCLIQSALVLLSTLLILSCGEANTETSTTDSPNTLIDTTINKIDSTATSIPPIYCCSNHTSNPHCGSENQLSTLTNTYGCTGFQEMLDK